MAPWIWTVIGIAIGVSVFAAAALGAIWFNDRQNSAGVSDE